MTRLCCVECARATARQSEGAYPWHMRRGKSKAQVRACLRIFRLASVSLSVGRSGPMVTLSVPNGRPNLPISFVKAVPASRLQAPLPKLKSSFSEKTSLTEYRPQPRTHTIVARSLILKKEEST